MRLKEGQWRSSASEQSWKRYLGGKSRELWLKEGDKNSKFFHKMVNAQRRKNFLASIIVDGRKLTEESEIKKGVVNAFQNILLEKGDWRPSIWGCLFLSWIVLRRGSLRRPFPWKRSRLQSLV